MNVNALHKNNQTEWHFQQIMIFIKVISPFKAILAIFSSTVPNLVDA